MPYTGEFPKTILLADDDEDDRSFFKDALYEVAGTVQLMEVANGIEAMNLLVFTMEYLVRPSKEAFILPAIIEET